MLALSSRFFEEVDAAFDPVCSLALSALSLSLSALSPEPLSRLVYSSAQFPRKPARSSSDDAKNVLYETQRAPAAAVLVVLPGSPLTIRERERGGEGGEGGREREKERGRERVEKEQTTDITEDRLTGGSRVTHRERERDQNGLSLLPTALFLLLSLSLSLSVPLSISPFLVSGRISLLPLVLLLAASYACHLCRSAALAQSSYSPPCPTFHLCGACSVNARHKDCLSLPSSDMRRASGRQYPRSAGEDAVSRAGLPSPEQGEDRADPQQPLLSVCAAR